MSLVPSEEKRADQLTKLPVRTWCKVVRLLEKQLPACSVQYTQCRQPPCPVRGTTIACFDISQIYDIQIDNKEIQELAAQIQGIAKMTSYTPTRTIVSHVQVCQDCGLLVRMLKVPPNDKISVPNCKGSDEVLTFVSEKYKNLVIVRGIVYGTMLDGCYFVLNWHKFAVKS